MRSFLLFTCLAFAAACSTSDKSELESNGAANQLGIPDADGDGFGDEAAGGNDCDDTDADINPGEAERCDTIDNDCDGDIDDDDSSVVANYWGPDLDLDGYTDANGYVFACNVNSFSAFVEAAEGDSSLLVYWIQPTEYEDTDGDGIGDTMMVDCNDGNASTFPGATEVCDGEVNDCDAPSGTIADDGLTAWYYADSDGDTYGDPSTATEECSMPSGYVTDDTDCDDSSGSVNPAATELCDAWDVDEDCDGDADNADASVTGQTDYYVDADVDGYGTGSVALSSCEAAVGYADNDTDCDDTDAAVWSETTWSRDSDGDGYGTSSASYTSCYAPPDYVSTSGDCDDSIITGSTVYPGATELGNGIDDDCDGLTDEGVAYAWSLEIYGDELLSVTADFSDDTFDGDLVTGVSGIGLATTSLGGGVWYNEFSGNYHLDTGEWIDLDIVFADGSVACDTDLEYGSGSVFVSEDGVEYTMTNVATDTDGDGFTDACVIRVTW